MTCRVLGLFGGGADSALAATLLARAGWDVACVHFRTGFVRPERSRRVDQAAGGLHLETIDVLADYLRQVVLEPRHGYGAGMNPCIDCRIFMLRRADELARRRGIDLLFTGEVLGQRAWDQSRAALATIEREARVEGRVLRPLSAGLLPDTTPERRAGRLEPRLRLHGRGRRGQRDLARELGLVGLPTPSGGCCLLADRGFARRLRDLLAHRDAAEIGAAELERLRRGRHFRLDWQTKVILGRDERESAWLREHAGEDWTCQAADGRGTFGLVEGDPALDGERLEGIGALVARYSGARGGAPVDVVLRRGAERHRVRSEPAADAVLADWRV